MPSSALETLITYGPDSWQHGSILLADTGAGVYTDESTKAGYQARDLAEWEEVYGGMMKTGIEHPQVIGFAWCGLYETPSPRNRSGIVDCRNGEPLAERLKIVRRWNQWMEERCRDQFTEQPSPE